MRSLPEIVKMNEEAARKEQERMEKDYKDLQRIKFNHVIKRVAATKD